MSSSTFFLNDTAITEIYSLSLHDALPIFIVILLMYKFVLRVFFGMVIIPNDRIGLVVKKYTLSGSKRLPDGRIIAIDGEAGMQAKALAPGLYWCMWPWQITITMEAFTIIDKVNLGLVN